MFELAGYETLELIGDGGFGEVWLAVQNSTGRDVAVKVAHAPIVDETLKIRFKREYQALGRLSGHPNIVDIVTAGTLPDGRAFLVLEFVEGGTLWDRSQHEQIEEDDLIGIGIGLAKALKAAHDAGVLHRDVKPENVLLRDTRETVLSDFGLAHLVDGVVTSSNAVVASVAYAAPEILQGKSANTSTDIYGLGVCLLTAAIRSVPFVELHDKSIQTVIQRVLSEPPKDVSQLGYSDLFNSLLTDLMAKDPKDRLSTAGEALQRLEELPQLRTDQHFSWADLLGASETTAKSASSTTAQFETIQIDEPNEIPTDDAAPVSDSESKLGFSEWHEFPTSNKDPNVFTSDGQSDISNHALENEERSDDVDSLISELTMTEQAEKKEAEGNTKHVEDSPNIVAPKSEEVGTETLDSISGDDAEPTNAANVGAKSTAEEPNPSNSAVNESDSRSGQSFKNRSTENPPKDASSESTIEMSALTIGQPRLPIRPRPKPSPKADHTRPRSSTADRANKSKSAVNAGVQKSPNDDTNFLDRLIDVDQPRDERSFTSADRRDVIAANEAPAPATEPGADNTEPDHTSPFKRLFIGLAILAGISILTGLLLRAILPGESDDSPQITPPSGQAAPLALPLSSDDEGFPPGTIESTTPALGPTSPLFCENPLDASNMSNWKGSQFYFPNEVGSIDQLVVGFENEQSADLYVSAIEESLNCDMWRETFNGYGYSVSAEPALESTAFGDRLVRFDITANSADGPMVGGETYVVRSSANVAVVGARAQDQDTLDELLTLAQQAGASFVEDVEN